MPPGTVRLPVTAGAAAPVISTAANEASTRGGPAMRITQHARTITRTLRNDRCLLLATWVCGVLLLVAPRTADAQGSTFGSGVVNGGGPTSSVTPQQLEHVTFKQRLNQQLPLDAAFKDEYGRTVTLGRYFGRKKPVILAFVYYTCPMLCTQIMNGISASLRELPFTAGQDFDVVLISFDPRDNPAAAADKKRTHLAYWNSEDTSAGWHFLTGDEATIARVTNAAGFTYTFDRATGQYAHVSGVLVATPAGRLARYFYGVEYSPKELRLALVESGQGHIGSAIDELLLYCYHYDPQNGRYGATVMNLLRAGGVLTLLAIAAFFLIMRRDPANPPLAH
jgi:protein SCO1/2